MEFHTIDLTIGGPRRILLRFIFVGSPFCIVHLPGESNSVLMRVINAVKETIADVSSASLSSGRMASFALTKG